MCSYDFRQGRSRSTFPPTTDWTLCALCQTNTRESLQCPANNTKTLTTGSSYTTLAENLQKFAELGCPLPVPIELSRLHELIQEFEEALALVADKSNSPSRSTKHHEQNLLK